MQLDFFEMAKIKQDSMDLIISESKRIKDQISKYVFMCNCSYTRDSLKVILNIYNTNGFLTVNEIRNAAFIIGIIDSSFKFTSELI